VGDIEIRSDGEVRQHIYYVWIVYFRIVQHVYAGHIGEALYMKKKSGE